MAAKPQRRHAVHKRPKPSILELRIRDLSRLRAGRYGERIPDTPDARRLIAIIAGHMAAIPGARHFVDIPNWLSLYAPWCDTPAAAEIIREATAKPKFWKAHELGWTLKLSAADRKALRITTIGAFDMSPQQRAKLRREMKRLEREQKRREKGAIPRDQYEAKSLTKSAPWKAEGISRAQWYRRRKAVS